MTFDAKWYNLLHTGNESDVSFYVSAVSGADSVLELGCGAGRITIPIARSGVSITGVDNAEDMLSLLRLEKEKSAEDTQNRIEIVHADMRTLELKRRFEKVIIPYNGLLCMLSDEDLRSVLRTAAAHLKRHGELIFDIYDVPSDILDEDSDEEDDAYEFIESILDGKKLVTVLERSVPHPDPRRFDAAYRYQTENKRGEVQVLAEYTIPQRCVLKEDIPPLLQSAGFVLTSMSGDFRDIPVDEDTGQVVVRARLQTAD